MSEKKTEKSRSTLGRFFGGEGKPKENTGGLTETSTSTSRNRIQNTKQQFITSYSVSTPSVSATSKTNQDISSIGIQENDHQDSGISISSETNESISKCVVSDSTSNENPFGISNLKRTATLKTSCEKGNQLSGAENPFKSLLFKNGTGSHAEHLMQCSPKIEFPLCNNNDNNNELTKEFRPSKRRATVKFSSPISLDKSMSNETIFPILKLTLPSSFCQQIREFFDGPAPALFCGKSDLAYEFSGVLMEWSIRRMFAPHSIGGKFKDIIGWKGEPLRYHEISLPPPPISPTFEGHTVSNDKKRKSLVSTECITLINGKKLKSTETATRDWADMKTVADSKPIAVYPLFRKLSKYKDIAQDSSENRKGDINSKNNRNGKFIKDKRVSSRGRIIKTPHTLDIDDDVSTNGNDSVDSVSSLSTTSRRKQYPKFKPLRPLTTAQEPEFDPNDPDFAPLAALYKAKGYLSAGLYSASYKSSKTTSENVRSVRASYNSLRDNDFIFPLPENYGEWLLNETTDFRLPYDLTLWVECKGGLEIVQNMQIEREPTPYQKLRQNIFVERKPIKSKETAICQCTLPEDGKMGCGEDCLNRAMFMECSPKDCPLGELCSNQTIQRRQGQKNLQVFWTASRGHGLKTLTDIPKGALAIEYLGEIISQKTCVKRMSVDYANFDNFYFLSYNDTEVIDGTMKGNEARFVNHSCNPNCHIEKWYINGEYGVGLFASKDIPAGTELTYDYRFESFGPMQKCMCGSHNCRGFLGLNKKVIDEKQEDAKLKKLKRRKNKKMKINSAIIDRIYWLKKQYREKLASAVTQVIRHRNFFHSSKLLLARNMKIIAQTKLPEKIHLDGLIESGRITSSIRGLTDHHTDLPTSYIHRRRHIDQVALDLQEKLNTQGNNDDENNELLSHENQSKTNSLEDSYSRSVLAEEIIAEHDIISEEDELEDEGLNSSSDSSGLEELAFDQEEDEDDELQAEVFDGLEPDSNNYISSNDTSKSGSMNNSNNISNNNSNDDKSNDRSNGSDTESDFETDCTDSFIRVMKQKRKSKSDSVKEILNRAGREKRNRIIMGKRAPLGSLDILQDDGNRNQIQVSAQSKRR